MTSSKPDPSADCELLDRLRMIGRWQQELTAAVKIVPAEAWESMDSVASLVEAADAILGVAYGQAPCRYEYLERRGEREAV